MAASSSVSSSSKEVDGMGAMPLHYKSEPLDVNPGPKLQLNRYLRISSEEMLVRAGGGSDRKKMEDGDMDSSSICLDCMVLSYIEEMSSWPRRCSNCYDANSDVEQDDSDDEQENATTQPISNSEILKVLAQCLCIVERNLLADVQNIVERIEISGMENEKHIQLVMESLQLIGYDASICKSWWKKMATLPAQEYKFIDVIVSSKRMVVDMNFRSKFETALSTEEYNAAVQYLPLIFVGDAGRLHNILEVLDKAQQRLKKNGVKIPPWHKVKYLKSMWFSQYLVTEMGENVETAEHCNTVPSLVSIAAETSLGPTATREMPLYQWQPYIVRSKGATVVGGLTALLDEKL